MLVIEIIHHVHIYSCVECKSRCFLSVLSISLIAQLDDGVPVGDDEAVETPGFLENFCHGVAVGRGRDAAYVVECAHHRRRALIYSGSERWEIGIPKCLTGDFSVDIVTSGLRCGITDKVLEAGCNCALLRQTGALIATHGGTAELGSEKHVLPVAFHDPAPARVAGDINHRRECPVHTAGRGLTGGISTNSLHERWIPAGSLSKRNRSHCPIAVDDVMSKKHGDAETGLLHAALLHRVAKFRIIRKINHGAGFRRHLANHLTKIVLHSVASQRVLVHLHYLLFQRHP